MKKIIYSFVIMIAAGSLFTSCVTNTEPQGIKDIREAKADYLESLAKVKDADARFRDAETALKAAEAAVKEAEAKQAEIKTAIKQAKADTAIAGMKAAAEIAAVKAQEALAQAQADLEKTLREIAAAAIGLTGAEKDTLAAKTTALNLAYSTYNAWLSTYNKKVKELWEAEYDVAAGVVGYETAESYKDSIAAENDKIATANEVIASLEALKEHPQAVKDSLDAIDAQIADLNKQWTLIQSDKILYEATPSFVESKSAFVKRVLKFENDSLKGYALDFKFADEDGKALAYDMNVVYKGQTNRVDTLFKWAAEPLTKTTDKYNYGLTFQTKDGYSQFVMPVEGKDTTSAILYGVKDTLGLTGIVEALKRDLVLVNGDDSTKAAEAAVKAKEADSTYKAHRAILEAGLEKYQPLIDSQAVVKAKDSALTAAKAVLAQKEAKFKADSNAVVTAIKGVSAELIVAAEEFAAATNNLMSSDSRFYSKTSDDSARFIAAAVTLGKAKAKYFGVQDSIELIEVNLEGAEKPYGVPFSELKASGFVQTLRYPNGDNVEGTSLYGGQGYGAYKSSSIGELKNKAWYTVSSHNGHYVATDWAKDAFTKVVRLATGTDFSWGANIEAKQVLYAGTYYKKESPVAYDMCSWTDTVKWYKHFIGTEATAAKKGDFAKVAVKADYEKMAASKDSVIAAAADTVKAHEAVVKAKQGVETAKGKYYEVYAKFYGINKETAASLKDTTAKKFAWTAKTFEEPTLCVWFKDGYTDILKNPTLDVILESMDHNYNRDLGAKGSGIFWNGNWTEYALKLQAEQEAYIASHYTEILDQLANIEDAVEQACEDFEAAYSAWKEKGKVYDDVRARLYGVDKNGDIRFVKNPALIEANVADGKWNFGGYLLEWAEELAPEYPAIVKAVNDKAPAILAEKAILENYKTTLDWIYTVYFDWFEAEKADQVSINVEGILNALNGAIKHQKETVIAGCESEITRFEKQVALCEAGYSPAEAKLASLKETLESYKRSLEQAEEALAIAQKEYDEVIAKYGVRN